MQIIECKPAIRGTKQRQPGNTITDMAQCPRQRQQILHHRPVCQSLDFHGLEAELGLLQLRDNLYEVGASANKNRGRTPRVFSLGPLRNRQHMTGFANIIASQ